MKTKFQIKVKPFLSLIAGLGLTVTMFLGSCSTGTDSADDPNVERAEYKSGDPTKYNRVNPDTLNMAENAEESNLEHYEQTYGGAQEPPSNPDVNNNDPSDLGQENSNVRDKTEPSNRR